VGGERGREYHRLQKKHSMVEIKAEDNEEWTGVGNTKVQK